MKTQNLKDVPWKVSYSTEIGNPVTEFYEPALTRSIQYDRITGYFSANTLAVVARGMSHFVRNGGKMRLVVSVQLNEEDAIAIERGYELRKKIDEKLASVSFDNLKFWSDESLRVLTKLIAEELLEVRVGILKDSTGKLVTSPILHDKVGILTDSEGNKISFIGSNNETGAGWELNSESFEVACSWMSGNDPIRVQEKVEQFERVWSGGSSRLITLPFPMAIFKNLIILIHNLESVLSFSQSEPNEDNDKTKNNIPEPIPVEEQTHSRNEIWTYLKTIPTLPEGITVGMDTSCVQPWQHQLRNFKRAYSKDPVRLLIADEVGLGKTISAGLILRQMILSGRAKRVLLLAPGGVLVQWQNELYEKFNLSIPIYDGSKLIYRKTHSLPERSKPVSKTEWSKEPFVLMSTFLARRQDRQSDILQSDAWDFLLVDEVHHARRKGAGTSNEGAPNLLLRLLRSMKQNNKIHSILFLSATPMQVHPVELWDLLSLLGLPNEWNENNFLEYYNVVNSNLTTDQLIFLRQMFQSFEKQFGDVTTEDWNKTLANEIPNTIARDRILRAFRDRARISLDRLTFEEREYLKKALFEFNPVKSLIARSTRSLLKEYFRRGILKHRIPTRSIQDIPLDMPPSEKAFYDEVENYIKEVYDRGMGGNRGNTGFILTIYRRRLASSYYALYQTLTKRLEQISGRTGTNLVSDEDVEEDDIADREEDINIPNPFPSLFQEEKDRINQLLKMISKMGTPLKCVRLFDELKKQEAEGKKDGIIFTQFTDTLNFLKGKFTEYFPEEVIGCYSGDGAVLWEGNRQSRITKEQLKEKFRKGQIRYLLCTDAAAEGLNLQFAGLLVNYDLPWNPMKVEQRIGRIDRIGQTHEIIKILNFAYKGTVEAEIYFRLADRIQLFQGIIGKLQPILTVLKSELEKLFLLEGEERKDMMDRLMARLEEESRTKDSTKDIDVFSEDHSKFPEFPPTKVNMEMLKNIWKNPDYRPADIGWSAIDTTSFKLNYPGSQTPYRVTFDIETFDRDPLNHEFISYGNWIFDEVVKKYGDG
ncbi:MAG TPA: helicase-related protein [Leptospiraceae bacterium]|nr:helicase-related protein [Leptospiraceae bacterium]HRG75283.1 helicase-related protein [Leptospiraceae bacterium]